MLKPDVCDEIATVIRREDFYDETHGLLFLHMQDMHNAGKRVDITLLVDRLKKAGDFEKHRWCFVPGPRQPGGPERRPRRVLREHRA